MNKIITETQIHTQKPEGFIAQVEIAACYIEIGDRFLLLQRAGKEAGTWGVPAGKLEKDETPHGAAIRELFEETGISEDKITHVKYLDRLFFQKPDFNYVYHSFKIQLSELPHVRLSDEHLQYTWATLAEIENLPLMAGAKEALQHYRKLNKRTGASVNAYLILKQQDRVLFQLRKNTGYCDGMWSLMAGHVEDGESATDGLIREANEELGIELIPSDLKVVHVMHRRSNRFNVDVFFECTTWRGTIQNREPEKCECIEFFSLDQLPTNMVDYNRTVFQNNNFYSEEGWDK